MTDTHETLGLPDLPRSLKWAVIDPDADQPTLLLIQKALPEPDNLPEHVTGSRILPSKSREDIAVTAELLLEDQKFACTQPAVIGDHYGTGPNISPLILDGTIPHPPAGLFWRFKMHPYHAYALTFQLRKPWPLGSTLVAEQSVGTVTLEGLGEEAGSFLSLLDSNDSSARVQKALRDLS